VTRPHEEVARVRALDSQGLNRSQIARLTGIPRTKTYAYARYNFGNRSDEIRALSCEYCDRVGVAWQRMNRWTISVAQRQSVALMLTSA
jgi:hypothetical protein